MAEATQKTAEATIKKAKQMTKHEKMKAAAKANAKKAAVTPPEPPKPPAADTTKETDAIEKPANDFEKKPAPTLPPKAPVPEPKPVKPKKSQNVYPDPEISEKTVKHPKPAKLPGKAGEDQDPDNPKINEKTVKHNRAPGKSGLEK